MLTWCCCDCNTTINQTVTGCSANLSGVTVNIKVGGSTVGTGTTNGSGYVSITVSQPSGTSATVEIVAPAHFITNTGTITLNCSTITRTTALSVDTASYYYCTHDCGCSAEQVGSPPYYRPPIPSTLYLDDGYGTVTLSLVGSYDPNGINVWRGNATRSATTVTDTCSPCVSTGGGSTIVFFEVSCSSDTWSGSLRVPVCGGFCTTIYPKGSPSTGDNTGTTYGVSAAVDGSCRPFAMTFSISGLWSTGGAAPDFVYSSTTVTLTVTE
jgi:hypothetical protein